MYRSLALTLLVLTVVGCANQQQPTCDPFRGRTTIPPPPTGAITGRVPDPGYQPPTTAPPPCGGQPPLTAQPQPGTNPAWAPPATNSKPATLPGTTLPGVTPNYSAPRPSSTVPQNLPPPPPSTAPYPSSTSNPRAGGSGTASVGVNVLRSGASYDDRSPRPVDDAGAEASLAGRKPIVRAIEPREKVDASHRPIMDITDLPKAP